jgi:hypothetical protein
VFVAIRIRTARSINEAARWTRSPRHGWRYWAVLAVAYVLVITAPSRWTWLVVLLAFVAPWVAERLWPSTPDLDEEARKDPWT